MPTVNQLVRKGRKPAKSKSKAPALHWVQNTLRNRVNWVPGGSPQRRGVSATHKKNQIACLKRLS